MKNFMSQAFKLLRFIYKKKHRVFYVPSSIVQNIPLTYFDVDISKDKTKDVTAQEGR